MPIITCLVASANVIYHMFGRPSILKKGAMIGRVGHIPQESFPLSLTLGKTTSNSMDDGQTPIERGTHNSLAPTAIFLVVVGLSFTRVLMLTAAASTQFACLMVEPIPGVIGKSFLKVFCLTL